MTEPAKIPEYKNWLRSAADLLMRIGEMSLEEANRWINNHIASKHGQL